VPVNVVVCVLFATLLLLSVNTSVPLRLPLATGVKITAIVQEVFAASVALQVVSWPKSPGLVPVIAKPVMLKATVPVLVRLTTWGVLVVSTG
jgi:hypothetical protein